MRLFHFSDDGGIARFVPQPPAVAAPRAAGMDWLNGPLVWAIDDWHQPLYLFPRQCPRILVWPVAATTAGDRALWNAAAPTRMLAYIEQDWCDRLASGAIYRYELPETGFESLEDAGMWICREPVAPIGLACIGDLPATLAAQGVTLKPLPDLGPLRTLWNSSLHVSGIRLRNARTWPGVAPDKAASWSLP